MLNLRKVIVLKIIFILSLTFLIINCSREKVKDSGLSGELSVFIWADYFAETTISNFEKRFAIKVNCDYYASNEELLGEIQAGIKKYDLIFPSDYMVGIMIKESLLAAIDRDNISNFKNIDEHFKDLPYDRGNKYSIPYQWGSTGIGINTKKVKDGLGSWDILWDEKYKGKISMLKDIRSLLIPALKKLGYSINTTNPDKLNRAKELLIEQRRLVKEYSNDTYTDLLRFGEVWIAQGFSGDIYQVMQDNPDIEYVNPMEGTEIWIDFMCIPHNAPHKRRAEVFINYILEPKVSAEITNATWYASPNSAAKQFIKKEILDNLDIYIPYGEFNTQRYSLLKDIGEDTQIYEKMFAEIIYK